MGLSPLVLTAVLFAALFLFSFACTNEGGGKKKKKKNDDDNLKEKKKTEETSNNLFAQSTPPSRPGYSLSTEWVARYSGIKYHTVSMPNISNNLN